MKHSTALFCLSALICLAFSPYVAAGPQIPDINYHQVWEDYSKRDALIEPGEDYPFESCFKLAAKKYKLPKSLLLAVARGESLFDPKAVSNRKCYGLMQIKWPETAKHLGIHKKAELFNPCTNILAGAKYLRELLDRYDNNLHLALAAYNYGPGRIPRNAAWTKIPQGANWYSGYIYHHLTTVLNRKPAGASNKPQKQIAVITFKHQYRAKGFLNYLRQKAPTLELDVLKTDIRRFQVVLLYKHPDELIKGKAILNHLGIEVTIPAKV